MPPRRVWASVTAAALLALVAHAASAPSAAAACPRQLFAYFKSDERMYYALAADALHWTVLNKNQPVLATTIAGTSLRDVYVGRGHTGGYLMVATNGHGFGNTPTIITYNSSDLITWSAEFVADVMSIPGGTVTDTWAPEFLWDPVSSSYFVFWAAKGNGLVPPAALAGCTNPTAAAQFMFFGAHTPDLQSFSPPTMFFAPGCNATQPVGDGGIDGDIVLNSAGQYVMLYKDARGANESVRGVRSVTSSSGSPAGPYFDAGVGPLLIPPLVEGPEALWHPDLETYFLYYDCSFYPTPRGRSRPPYGVATGPLDGGFTPVEGSCTGEGTSVSFPDGATHGSFLCIDEATADELTAAFPP